MRLTVVIPTRNRLTALRRTLSVLAEQDLSRQDVEVVVVDDGEGAVADVDALAEGYPFSLHAFETPNPGVTAARNAGLRAANGDVVLFLGDDTYPSEPSLLARHLESHVVRPEPTYGLLGRVAWAPELEVTPLMEWLERGPQFDFANMRRGPAKPEHLYTSHVSLKRALLIEVGGFDERLGFLFEDSELGLRLFARGLELDYQPDLLVHHDHAITLAGWRTRERVAGRAARRLHAVHPEAKALAPRPKGPRWRVERALGAALARVPGEWRSLPAPLRNWVYLRLHNAAYAEGYRAEGSRQRDDAVRRCVG